MLSNLFSYFTSFLCVSGTQLIGSVWLSPTVRLSNLYLSPQSWQPPASVWSLWSLKRRWFCVWQINNSGLSKQCACVNCRCYVFAVKQPSGYFPATINKWWFLTCQLLSTASVWSWFNTQRSQKKKIDNSSSTTCCATLHSQGYQWWKFAPFPGNLQIYFAIKSAGVLLYGCYHLITYIYIFSK